MITLPHSVPPVNPTDREPFTPADLAWAAIAFNAEPEPEPEPEPDWDWLAVESEALDRLCMGLCL